MTPREVAASYDRIADRWSAERFNPLNGIAQHRRALSFLGHCGGKALDVGCGASGRFIELLRSEGMQPEGLDLSSEMLRLARLRHPGVAFHHADICEWTPEGPYRFITAWDSVWHVPLSKQESVLRKLCRALDHGGILIFSAGGTEQPEERSDCAMGVPMYHATLGVQRILSMLENCSCRLRHFEYDQYPEAHVYFVAEQS